jgi:epoxyqueuosine reductase QueG
MIITDAELPATPLLTESVCDKCMACVKACPMGAIGEECEEVMICGKVMTVAKIDYEKCKQCKNGAVKNRFSDAARPDRIAAVCNRTCMVCLEENARVSNLFEKQFRTAPAWVDGNRGEKK